MVKLKYYTYGQYRKTLKMSDKEFTIALLNGSLTHSDGNWYKDCGLGVYFLIRK